MATPRPKDVLPRLRIVRGGESGDGVGDIGREPISDEALVLALRRGDAQKAALLYDRLIRVVDGSLVRLLGRREQDHDDLVQSVFEQLFIALRRERFAEPAALRGYAAAIACNVGLNVLRSRVRERRVVDRGQGAAFEASRAGSLDVERQMGARSELARVCEELAAMNREQATAVVLFDVFGHDLTEVATLTGVSLSAAQSRLVRGRKALHERLCRAKLAGRGVEDDSWK